MLLAALLALPASAASPLVYPERCIFEAVAARMRAKVDPAKPLPRVKFKSSTGYEEFKSDYRTEYPDPFWTLPDGIMNLLLPRTNIIYLDDLHQYTNGRSVTESAAHEYAHYVQWNYLGADFASVDADRLEGDAIQVQFWFRESYLIPGLSPCSR